MTRRRRSRAVDADTVDGQAATALPRYPGPLATMLGTAPVFRKTLRGYDRLQVDGYVAWTEEELLTQRRTIRELITQFRESLGELEGSRLLARSAEGKQLIDVADLVGRMLADAADEATEVAAAGVAVADEVVTVAHREARTRLQSIRDLRQRVQVWCDAVRSQAEEDRARAREVLAQARAEAERLVAEAERHLAEAERRRAADDRAADEAAAARLAAANQELAEVQERTRTALSFLRGLDHSIATTLSDLERADGAPLNFVATEDDRVHLLRPTA